MKEVDSHKRRYMNGFYFKFCQGKGLHIGYGEPSIKPGVDYINSTEKDFEKLPVEDSAYQFIYSSVLQETSDPQAAIEEWWRAVMPGGFLIICAQDEDLYEQRQWPSVFNTRHKCTLTISKDKSWSEVSNNLVELIHPLKNHHVISISLCDSGLDYSKLGKGVDQSAEGAETFIEAIIYKAPI